MKRSNDEAVNPDPYSTPAPSGNPRPKTKSRTAEEQSEEAEQLEKLSGMLLKVLPKVLGPMLDPVKQLLAAHNDRLTDLELWRFDVEPRLEKVVKGVDSHETAISKLVELQKAHSTALEKHKEAMRIALKTQTDSNTSLGKKYIELQEQVQKGAEANGSDQRKDQQKATADLAGRIDKIEHFIKHSAGASTSTGGSEGLNAEVEVLKILVEEMRNGREPMAEASTGDMEGLKAQMVALMAEMADLKSKGVHVHEPAQQQHAGGGPPSAASTVEAALKGEAEEASRVVKLVGFVEHKAGQEAWLICQEVEEVLSRMVGQGARIQVERAGWSVKEGHTPMLIVTMRTQAMAAAVRKLRLSEGKRIMGWFGRVEMAVRDVLFKEREAMLARDKQADVRVVGSRLVVKGKVQPLPKEAVVAGMQVITQPKQHRAAQPKPNGYKQALNQQGRRQGRQV
jgi:hypothetical protein